jgi:ketosteroid isomerase-like protein
MAGLLERLKDAMNSHDANNVAALFADDYQSVQPIHPNRGFGGRQQVTANWSAVFDGVPNFHAELLATSVDGDAEWGEWEWSGTYTDGSPFMIRGITVLVQRDGLFAQARLYLEPVEVAGGDIDAAVQEMYKPSNTQG